MKHHTFTPRKGQTDYSHVSRAPVINCIVRHKGKILLVKRGASVSFYPGYWHCISGFLDDKKSVKEKAVEELREETGIEERQITSLIEGPVVEYEAPQYQKTWVVHPVLVDVSTDKVTLDWEAEEYRWIAPERAKDFSLLPGFGRLLELLITPLQHSNTE